MGLGVEAIAGFVPADQVLRAGCSALFPPSPPALVGAWGQPLDLSRDSDLKVTPGLMEGEFKLWGSCSWSPLLTLLGDETLLATAPAVIRSTQTPSLDLQESDLLWSNGGSDAVLSLVNHCPRTGELTLGHGQEKNKWVIFRHTNQRLVVSCPLSNAIPLLWCGLVLFDSRSASFFQTLWQETALEKRTREHLSAGTLNTYLDFLNEDEIFWFSYFHCEMFLKELPTNIDLDLLLQDLVVGVRARGVLFPLHFLRGPSSSSLSKHKSRKFPDTNSPS